MNFNLFAITDDDGERDVYRIRLRQSLQSHLADLFDSQADDFISGVDEYPEFDPRTRLDDDERYIIPGFDLPAKLTQAIKNPANTDDLDLDDTSTTKAIVGAYTLKNGTIKRLAFQSFSRRNRLKTGLTILQDGNTFTRLDSDGFVLKESIDALYDADGLVFKTYITVNRFLDLSQIFQEASNEDIESVLDHSMFEVADLNAVIETVDNVLRRQFMALKRTAILDNVDADTIKSKSKDFPVTIEVKDGKILFPDNRKECKKLLRLLLEGYYHGELTGQPYATNDQRPIKNDGQPS